MLSQKEFITLSIDLNLFFLRIMKEHALFLQLGFTPKDGAMAADAASFRMGFEKLLSEATALAEENASQKTLESNQIVTPYTLEAEKLTGFFTGINIDYDLTKRELDLNPASTAPASNTTFNKVELLDKKAYVLTKSLAQFKEKLLNNVLACKTFTVNYPLLIDHIMREAKHYMKLLLTLLRGENTTQAKDLIDQEIFWNRIMAEHSKFIAGLLDPSEETLIDTARTFSKEFDALLAESKKALKNQDYEKVTIRSREKTQKLRNFKTAGLEGILGCNIRSVIIPLLGDHVLREANHYLCLLGKCN